MTTTTKTSKNAMQELAIALGMMLSTGAAIVVGGEKCPPTHKIVAALRASGWACRTLTRSERSDDSDDFGGRARHAITSESRSAEVTAILLSEIEHLGETMRVQDYLLLQM